MSSKRGGQNVASANALPAVLQAPVPFAAVLGGRPASGAGRATAGVGGGKAGGGAKGAKQAGTAGAAEEIASGVEEEEDDDDDEGEQKKPGRRKISIQFISDKSKRHITFSKRKAGVIKKAKELSSLTGAQVLLIVTSETGNIYDFSTPKFSKVLETFKTWYRSSLKDAQRIEGATGLKLREEEQEPVLVEVEGVLNREAPQELDPHSQRRISALVHVASTAECMSQAEHDEIAAAAWSLAPPSKKRPRDNDGRDINGPDYAANLRLVAEKDSTSSEASSAESQQALLQKTMMQHLLMWQMVQSSLLSWTGDSQNDMFGPFNPDVVYNPYVLSMLRFAYIQSHNAAGGVSEGVSVKTEGGQDDGEASTRAKGWRVSDPLPLPSATHTDSAIQEHTGGKNTKEPSHPCSSLPANGEGAVHTGVRGHGAGGGVTSRARVASPTPVMAHRRKPLIHQTPAWLKSGAASRGASHSESVLRAVDETDTDEHAEPALDPNKTDGASARSIAVGQSEVELLTSLRFPATSVSPPRSSNVVIPRLRKPELT